MVVKKMKEKRGKMKKKKTVIFNFKERTMNI